MKLMHWNASLMAVAVVGLFSISTAHAQRYDRGGSRHDLRDEVDHTYRDSKEFRSYFEHNFRANGHEPRWDGSDRYGHPEHQGRFGQMSLKDAIQNMDEDVERLHAEFRHRGASDAARDLAIEIRDHSNQVNKRIDRVGDWYRFQRDGDWRWERSELFNRWRDLRADINAVTRDIENRR